MRFVSWSTLIILFLASCSSDVDDDQQRILEAVDFLNGNEAFLEALDPGDGWINAKSALGLDADLVDASSFVRIAEDSTLEFYNVTEDCKYLDKDGLRATQVATSNLDDLRFRHIAGLDHSNRQFDTFEVFYLRVRFNIELLIITEWTDCQGGVVDYLSNDQQTGVLIFPFGEEAARAGYQSHLEVLMEAGY